MTMMFPDVGIKAASYKCSMLLKVLPVLGFGSVAPGLKCLGAIQYHEKISVYYQFPLHFTFPPDFTASAYFKEFAAVAGLYDLVAGITRLG